MASKAATSYILWEVVMIIGRMNFLLHAGFDLQDIRTDELVGFTGQNRVLLGFGREVPQRWPPL